MREGIVPAGKTSKNKTSKNRTSKNKTSKMKSKKSRASAAKSSAGAAKKPRRAAKRKIAAAPPLPPLPASAAFVQDADPAVRDLFTASSPLNAFLAGVKGLTAYDRALIFDQAIVLIDWFYFHLPSKMAMHYVV